LTTQKSLDAAKRKTKKSLDAAKRNLIQQRKQATVLRAHCAPEDLV
jgi:hypothetical protein